MPHALIVEDSKLQRDLYRFVLQQENFTSTEVTNGKAAIEYLENEDRPHLIILDIAMPETSGIDVLDYLETYPHAEDVYVFVATARSDNALNHYLQVIPIIERVTKPVVLPRLRKVIEHLQELNP